MGRTHTAHRRRFASTLVLAACLVGAPDAVAKDRPVNGAVQNHYAELDAGPAIEFRMLAVYPLERSSALFRDADRTGRPQLASQAEPLEVGLSARAGGGTRRLQFDNLGKGSLILLPGQIVRSSRYDLAVTKHMTVKPSGSAQLSKLAIVSRLDPSQDERAERAITRAWLPPSLRWVLSPRSKARDPQGTCKDWAQAAGLTGGRRSMADLGSGADIQGRVVEYASELRHLIRPMPGRDVVGYAAYLDDVPLVVETFADAATMRDAWPGLARALAVEAAVTEAETGQLAEDIPPSGFADRMRGATRTILRDVVTSKGISAKAGSTGTLWTLELDHGVLRGLTVRGSGVMHTFTVFSPGERAAIQRKAEEEFEDPTRFDPGELDRRVRLTKEEERVRERLRKRGGGETGEKPKPPAPPPIPAPNPMPPPVEIEEPTPAPINNK